MTLFESAGAMREVYRQVDWASTPLGPPETWSAALRGAVEMTLQTRFPVTLLWGAEFTLVYNEAYTSIIGNKHPKALGASARDTFPEAWDFIGPLLDDVLAGQPATWLTDAPVPLMRDGFMEECFFTFSYSAVSGTSGIEGVIDIATETTEEVIGRRRLQMLARLNAELARDADVEHDVLQRALAALRSDTDDIASADLLPHDDVPSGDMSVTLERHRTGNIAWLRIGTPSAAGERAVIRIAVQPQVRANAALGDFLALAAASVTQALDRVRIRQTEQRLAGAQRDLSDTLQRSLLTSPATTDGLSVAVRYRPASNLARIGGDWHDTFGHPDGRVSLVVGDITGHDVPAAAMMGQVRGLLRGVSLASNSNPAQVLQAVDDAIRSLELRARATVIVADVEPRRTDSGVGHDVDARTLRWSNAGHLPPVVVSSTGIAELLETTPELMLGVRPSSDRHDHATTLPAGSMALLYTDGLIERRGTSLEDSLTELITLIIALRVKSPDELCDALLAHYSSSADDDIALLAIQIPAPWLAGH